MPLAIKILHKQPLTPAHRVRAKAYIKKYFKPGPYPFSFEEEYSFFYHLTLNHPKKEVAGMLVQILLAIPVEQRNGISKIGHKILADILMYPRRVWEEIANVLQLLKPKD